MKRNLSMEPTVSLFEPGKCKACFLTKCVAQFIAFYGATALIPPLSEIRIPIFPPALRAIENHERGSSRSICSSYHYERYKKCLSISEIDQHNNHVHIS